MKVREVIERVIEKTGLTPIPHEKTCDHLMIGDGEMEVTKEKTHRRKSHSDLAFP